MTALVLVVLTCAVLNRLRGDDGWMPDSLPGRALFYVAPVFGIVAAILAPPLVAATFALAYLMWGVGPWGRWFDYGRLPEGFGREFDKPSAFERGIEAASFGSDHLAMLWRHLMAAPGFALVALAAGEPRLAWLALPFAVLAVVAGELTMRWRPSAAVPAAELFIGGLWGCGVVAAAFAIQQ